MASAHYVLLGRHPFEDVQVYGCLGLQRCVQKDITRTVHTQRYHTNGTYTTYHTNGTCPQISHIYIYILYIHWAKLFIYIYIFVHILSQTVYIYIIYLWSQTAYIYITLYIYIYLCKPCLNKLPNTNPVIQRRLEFLKAVRFGRSVLNELVWWASCEGLHSLGRIFIFRWILEN